ncbi:MAG: MBL fold metallo-hydrolase [Candidatus Rifleibacteriota bacterium]
MRIYFFASILFVMLGCFTLSAENKFESDVIPLPKGDITLTFVGHGTLFIEYDEKVIHIDPWSKLADYSALPKADLILITHEHRDHLDPVAVSQIRKKYTQIFYTRHCNDELAGGKILQNGDFVEAMGIQIKALPAYNIVHKRENGEHYHPKGRGNAYLLTILGKRILIGGDTENIPELKALKNIDIAFLPMNLPYTMTPEMVADLAKAMKPGVLYPYHFGQTDTDELVKLLKDHENIEVRIRKMQ